MQLAASRPRELTKDDAGVKIEQWGKSHWSTFAYLETLCVDFSDGVARPDLARVSANLNRHPGLVGTTPFGTVLDGSDYGIMLADGKTLPGPEYDEWDCIYDMECYGLLTSGGTGINPEYRLTDLGAAVVAQLRKHKAQGGKFGNFRVDLDSLT